MTHRSLIAQRLRAAIALATPLAAGLALQPACQDDDNECVVDADCPEGAICNSITDECEQGCRLDEDCRSGLICESDECVQGCRSDSDCGEGNFCSPISDKCIECSPGLANCPCAPGDACSGVLVCQGGVCRYPPGDDTPTCGDDVCAPGEECPDDCGGGPVCGDGLCAPGEACAFDCMPTCPNSPLGMAPFGPSPFQCGAAGPVTLALMSDINEFWGSDLVACVCGADNPLGPYCLGNAGASSTRNQAFGYSYFEPNKLADLQATAGGSLLAPAWFLAHEAGHNVQAIHGLSSPWTIYIELSADCLAGYFIGWLACQGEINEFDVQGTMMAACSGQDPVQTPWFDPKAHGTCQNRIDSTVWGMSAYFEGRLPQEACAP